MGQVAECENGQEIWRFQFVLNPGSHTLQPPILVADSAQKAESQSGEGIWRVQFVLALQKWCQIYRSESRAWHRSGTTFESEHELKPPNFLRIFALGHLAHFETLITTLRPLFVGLEKPRPHARIPFLSPNHHATMPIFRVCFSSINPPRKQYKNPELASPLVE